MKSKLSTTAAFSFAVGVVQRCLQIGATLLIMPMVVDSLGTSLLGIWAAAASLTWIVTALDLGIGSALITETARALAVDDRDSLERLLTSALWSGVVVALAKNAGALLLVPTFAPPELSDVYLIAAAFMALNVPFSFSTALWTGSQQVYMVWIWEAIQSILTAFGMWLLTLFTTDVRLYVALSTGGVVATNCASLSHFFSAILISCRQRFGLRSFLSGN